MRLSDMGKPAKNKMESKLALLPMTFEEIKAGLDKYTAETKCETKIKSSIKYIVEEKKCEHNTIYGVFAHYKTTMPDKLVNAFFHKANAELFCAIMNAEERDEPVDVVRHGKWKHTFISDETGLEFHMCSVCENELIGYEEQHLETFCPYCGAKMDAEEI